MTGESQSGPDSGLPYKDPLEAVAGQPESVQAPPEPAELSLRSPASDLDVASQSSLDDLLSYLGKGFDVLKGLNLRGFLQIYPIFVAILAAVVIGLAIIIVSNVLISINQFPLIGGLLQGLFELCGLIVVSRFAASNLLLQKERADLFLRIAELKKKLLGR